MAIFRPRKRKAGFAPNVHTCVTPAESRLEVVKEPNFIRFSLPSTLGRCTPWQTRVDCSLPLFARCLESEGWLSCLLSPHKGQEPKPQGRCFSAKQTNGVELPKWSCMSHCVSLCREAVHKSVMCRSCFNSSIYAIRCFPAVEIISDEGSWEKYMLVKKALKAATTKQSRGKNTPLF